MRPTIQKQLGKLYSRSYRGNIRQARETRNRAALSELSGKASYLNKHQKELKVSYLWKEHDKQRN